MGERITHARKSASVEYYWSNRKDLKFQKRRRCSEYHCSNQQWSDTLFFKAGSARFKCRLVFGFYEKLLLHPVEKGIDGVLVQECNFGSLYFGDVLLCSDDFPPPYKDIIHPEDLIMTEKMSPCDAIFHKKAYHNRLILWHY